MNKWLDILNVIAFILMVVGTVSSLDSPHNGGTGSAVSGGAIFIGVALYRILEAVREKNRP